jgi:REP element-mobilizing transposase RayT
MLRAGEIVVLAYHSIFTAYGFWLPNDPRGSWSDFVWAWELRRFGSATKTRTRRSVAAAAHDHATRLEAKEHLKYPPVIFNGRQALTIGNAFAETITKNGYVVYACSILPEHIHMVIRRHAYNIEQVVRVLKQSATEALIRANQHPLTQYAVENQTPPTPWARKGWNVFLDSESHIRRAIRYVELNPGKDGKRTQKWRFVTSYNAVSSPTAERRSLIDG